MIVAGVIVSGLVLGSLAGLNSVGFVLLWRSTRVVNLAQPAVGLVGGVFAGLLIEAWGWSFWAALPAALIVGALLGALTDRIVMKRIGDAPRAVLLVATVGLAALFGGIQSALPFLFTGRTLPTYSVAPSIGFDIGVEHLSVPKLLALLALPVAAVAVSWFLKRSRLGLSALALGQDEERARLLGVPATLVRSVVWTLAGLLSTLAGVLSIPIQGFNLAGGLGPIVLLLALAPAVFASFRSVYGAAVGALAVGVGYEIIHFYIARADIAELLFTGIVFVAIAVQGRRFGREAVAARAASWVGAAGVRPLPWHVAGSARYRRAAFAALAAMLAAAVVSPLLLSPSHRVLFATSAALAIGALSVAVAWMFAGEIALGNWGLAGLGALVAAFVPGPWPLRALVAAIVIGAVGGLLGYASRRRSNLSFAVIGLAIASAAPVVLQSIGDRTVHAGTVTAGAVAACVSVIAAAVIARLRSSRTGMRMVAARDDADRATWLGAKPVRERVLGLAISGALAGFAGAMYLASTPAGLAPGAFDPSRSLDVLAMAVIGGLASPAGAITGAAVVQLARFVLPDPWRSVASGAGVLIVVMSQPGGMSSAIVWIRARFARVVARTAFVEPVETTRSEVPA